MRQVLKEESKGRVNGIFNGAETSSQKALKETYLYNQKLYYKISSKRFGVPIP